MALIKIGGGVGGSASVVLLTIPENFKWDFNSGINSLKMQK